MNLYVVKKIFGALIPELESQFWTQTIHTKQFDKYFVPEIEANFQTRLTSLASKKGSCVKIII